MHISTIREQKHEPILMKLDMVDYVRDLTACDYFGGTGWVVWANMTCHISEFLFFLSF